MSRSTTEIEREVEAQRYEVEETLEALRAKLSTGQIIDSVARTFTGAGQQGNEFVANLGRQVRDNPLPIALTGVALAWLLMSQNKPRSTYPAAPPSRGVGYLGDPMYSRSGGSGVSYDRARYSEDEAKFGAEYAVGQLKAGAYAVRSSGKSGTGTAYDSAKYAADEARHGAEYAAGQLKSGAYGVADAAKGAAQTVYDQAKFAADETKHGLRYAGDQLKAGAYVAQDTATAALETLYDQAKFAADEARHGASYVNEQMKAGAYAATEVVQHAYEATRDAAYDAADTARVYSQRARRNAVDFIAEEPLIAAALGVAIGAAIGAALPATKVEDEYVGPTRDNLRDQAMDFAAVQAERAERIAERSLAAAEDTAKEEGLLPSGEGGGTLADKVQNVATSAVDAAKGELKGARDDAEDTAEDMKDEVKSAASDVRQGVKDTVKS